MEQQFWFEKGDVFRVEKGMTLCFFLSSKYHSYTFDENKREMIDVTVGEILKPGVPISRDKLIREIFWYLIKQTRLSYNIRNTSAEGTPSSTDGKITLEKISAFIDTLDLDFTPPELDTSVFVGEYVVDYRSYSAYCDQTSQLPTRVTLACHKLDDPSVILYLDQDRDFSSKYPNCKVIRREP